MKKLLEMFANFIVALLAAIASLTGLSSASEPPVVPQSNPAVNAYLEELHQANLKKEEPPPPPAPSEYGGVVGQWETLVRRYFNAADIPWAMRIIACESNGNTNAINSSSGAAGLFQQMPQYWAARSSSAGWGGYPATHPEANIAASAKLYYEGGPGHWVCK